MIVPGLYHLFTEILRPARKSTIAFRKMEQLIEGWAAEDGFRHIKF